MKTLVIYYSWGGHTRAVAERLAKEREAQLVEVLDAKRPGSFVGCFFRCPAAMAQKPGKVQPFSADFNAFDRIVIAGPVWANHPAPPVNSIIEKIPAGKAVELVLVSGGGSSAKEKVMAHLEKHGLKMVQYTDLPSGGVQ